MGKGDPWTLTLSNSSNETNAGGQSKSMHFSWMKCSHLYKGHANAGSFMRLEDKVT